MSVNGVALPGIDEASVTAWLTSNVDEVVPPFTFSLITGGNSNLTYRVEDAGSRCLALRRPPLGHVLESAHDVAREFRVTSALAATAVPVPSALGLCTDPAVNDAPFYVMDFVEGLVPHDVETGAEIPAQERMSVGESIVDVLAALHSLDPDEIGLGDLGKREDYVGRQLRRWSRQWEASKQRDIAEMETVRARLEAEIPHQERSTVVHGDFRLGNAIVAEGSVRAMLDWELCTLGDPLADVGYLLNSWMAPDEPVLWRSAATQAGGFGERDAAAARYAAATGTDISRVGYYRAFQAWRLAAILEGVYARYLHGAMGSTEGVDLQTMADSVVRLANQALTHLEP